MDDQSIDLTGARVLLVDDTPENLNVMRSTLQSEGFRIFCATSGEAALKVAQRTHPQIILMDVTMPGINGFETCSQLKSDPEFKHIPVVFVTARGDTEDILAGFNVGGVDYISKPIRQEEVLARVRTHLTTVYLLEKQQALTGEIKSQHEALERAYKELEEISVTDPVTGMKNRRFLSRPLDADTEHSLRVYKNWLRGEGNDPPHESDLGFFILDIDHFKSVNDNYGHAAGDRVLMQIKTLLEKIFRKSDYLIRWGGEEFLVVARFVDAQTCSILAARLRSVVEQHHFDIGNGDSINCTCSIGYAKYPFSTSHPEALTWSQIVDIADLAMYIAKKTQRNAWFGIGAGDLDIDAGFYQRLLENPQRTYREGGFTLQHSFEQGKSIVWE